MNKFIDLQYFTKLYHSIFKVDICSSHSIKDSEMSNLDQNSSEIIEKLERAKELNETRKFEEAWIITSSLLNEIESLDDFLACDILNEAARSRKWYKNDDSAKEFLERGLICSKQHNYRFGEAYALNYLGSYYRDNDNPREAFEKYSQALEIFKELNENFWVGNLYRNLAQCYFNQAQLSKALETTEQSFQYIDEENFTLREKRAKYRSFYLLLWIYYTSAMLDKALHTAKEISKLAKEINEPLGAIDAEVFQGVVLKRQGQLLKAKNQFEYVLNILKDVPVEQTDEIWHSSFVFRSRFNIAHTCHLLGHYDQAKSIYLSLLKEEEEKESEYGLSPIGGLGKLAIDQGNYEEAARYLEEAINKERKKDSGPSVLLVENIILLSTVYAELKDFSKARDFLEEARMIQTESKYSQILTAYGEGVLAAAERNLLTAQRSFEKCQRFAEEANLPEYRIRALFQLAALQLFEYRISGDSESLQTMNLLLEKVHSLAKALPHIALEIGILRALSLSTSLDFENAIYILEESLEEANKLGLSHKTDEILTLLNRMRATRKKAIEIGDPDFSLDSRKISEYMTNIQNLIRSWGEGRAL